MASLTFNGIVYPTTSSLRVEETAQAYSALLLAFVSHHGRVVRHALNAYAAGAEEAVQGERCASEQAGAQVGDVRIHRHAGVFPEEGSGFHVDGFAWCESLREHVAVAVEQQQAGAAFVHEMIDEKAGASEQHVGDAADTEEVVGDAVGGEQELVLADVDRFAGAQLEDDELAWRGTREGDVAGSGGLGDEDLDAGEDSFHYSAQGLDADVDAGFLPKQNVVLEVDVFASTQFHVNHWHQFAFDAHSDIAGTDDARRVAYLGNGLISGADSEGCRLRLLRRRRRRGRQRATAL